MLGILIAHAIAAAAGPPVGAAAFYPLSLVPAGSLVWLGLNWTAMFTLITAPVVAHRVGQLAYREQNLSDKLLTVDEIGNDPQQ